MLVVFVFIYGTSVRVMDGTVTDVLGEFSVPLFDAVFRPQSAASIVLSRDTGRCPRDIANVNYAYKVNVN